MSCDSCSSELMIVGVASISFPIFASAGLSMISFFRLGRDFFAFESFALSPSNEELSDAGEGPTRGEVPASKLVS